MKQCTLPNSPNGGARVTMTEGKYWRYEKYEEIDWPVRVRGRECLVKSRGDGCATSNSDDKWQQWLVFYCCYFTSLKVK